MLPIYNMLQQMCNIENDTYEKSVTKAWLNTNKQRVRQDYIEYMYVRLTEGATVTLEGRHLATSLELNV